MKSLKDFSQTIKIANVLQGYQMVYFDVKSLFTNVLSENEIDLVLRIYGHHKIFISIAEIK